MNESGQDEGNRAMSEPILRTIRANGINLRIAEQGSGPVVLLCHGVPESW